MKAHDLEASATVVHSPLIAYDLAGKRVRWYETSGIPESARIDMFVIDGPPAKDNYDTESRFPALPLLYSRLSDGATVILNDAAREGEKQIVQEWLSCFPDLHHQYLDLEKGASLLVKEKPCRLIRTA